MIYIKSLTIMQEHPRDLSQIAPMVEYVRNGGFWTQEALTKHNVKKTGLIYISGFPDGVRMIHDGHHRVLATYLGGRDYLRLDELIAREWRYEQYGQINWEHGYFTPHDPKTEVRLPDFLAFKNHVKNILATEGKAQAELYIKDSKSLYCKKRDISTVAQMARLFQDTLLEA